MPRLTKKELENRMWQDRALHNMGFSDSECIALRRISNTLRRWYELECGTENDYGTSFAIERDPDTEKPLQVVRPRGDRKPWRYQIPDRERGAEKRLGAIMAKHPDLVAYLQTDPRGASLYILRQDQVKPGEMLDCIYTRGICVY